MESRSCDLRHAQEQLERNHLNGMLSRGLLDGVRPLGLWDNLRSLIWFPLVWALVLAVSSFRHVLPESLPGRAHQMPFTCSLTTFSAAFWSSFLSEQCYLEVVPCHCLVMEFHHSLECLHRLCLNGRTMTLPWWALRSFLVLAIINDTTVTL